MGYDLIPRRPFENPFFALDSRANEGDYDSKYAEIGYKFG